MRKSFVANSIKCISFLLLLSSALLQAGCGGPSVVWAGNVSADVIDQNIDLNGTTVNLIGGVAVHAVTCNIAINVNAATIIEGDPAAGNSRLYLNPAAGHTIVVNVTNDLTFQGAAAGATGELDLLVTVTGAGTVVFNITSGNEVTLQRNGANGGAVQMYRQGNPAQTFAALNFTTNQVDGNYASVIIGSGCILSYLLANDGSNSAQINFIQSNGTLQPEMRLVIQDKGAVLVRSNLLTPSAPKYVIADIDLASVPGTLPSMIFAVGTLTPTAPAGLRIENSNNTLGQFLWDPWCAEGLRADGSFSGVQYGFIVGSSGELFINSYTFLDYIALSLPQCPTPVIPCVAASAVASLVKSRNPSALFTDSFVDSTLVAPVINIAAHAGLYLRSGVGANGVVNADFTVDPTNRTSGAGVPVMDIEGQLFVLGANIPGNPLNCFVDTQLSKIEVLSWQVDSTVPANMGPLFTDNTVANATTNPFIFPGRTFATVTTPVPCSTDQETTSYYIAYNKGYILNNGRADLITVSLDHTDEIHLVTENNDVTSEPTYVGGETWNVPCPDCAQCIARPLFAFYNSRFNVHTSVALTGVDLLTEVGGPSGNNTSPSGTFTFCNDNYSLFVFYQNGKTIDNGSGRSMILGTFPGSTACDGCTVISKDAHLNVMQDNVCNSAIHDELVLTTTANTALLVPGIPAGDLSQQYAIQTIYLGNNSNISIGSESSDCLHGLTQNVRFPSYPGTQTSFLLNPAIFPTLLINSNLFSFETRGGSNNLPETSNVTGQGGIFVDANGVFTIGGTRLTSAQQCVQCLFRANMGAMVTASCNGFIDLPANRVLFDPRVGIAFWNLNMNVPSEVVIVQPGQEISDYTLNWLFVTKDYDVFMPYYLTNCYSPCFCPAVTTMNVDSIPTIEGTVQQLLIKGSRLGDPAHVKVRGGTVGELIMLTGFNSSEAPVAVIVLEDQGQIGLGSAKRNADSLDANIVLGVNGVNVILNDAEAQVNLNEDVIVNNICAFLPGPDIPTTATLRIKSECCHTLRVTKDGVLDLSGFGAAQAVEFAGNVRVVFEPGSKVIFANETTLRWVDEATCEFEPTVFTNLFSPNSLVSTDTVRVHLVGSGRLEFNDCSSGIVPRDAFVGVENDLACVIATTDITLRLNDSATFKIGDPACRIPGGAFQVGNTVELDQPEEGVSFTLIVDGPEASFEIGEQGFLGLGVGIVSKGRVAPDAWLVGPTFNVTGINLQLSNGRFMHAQLYAGSDTRASLIAMCGGAVPFGPFTYNISPLFDTTDGTLLSNMSMLGGGNIVACPPTITQGGQPYFNPIVGVINGTVNTGLTNQYEVGILCSTPILATFGAAGIDAISLQQFLRVKDIITTLPANGRGDAAPSDLRNQVRVGFVDTAGAGGDGFIGRAEVEKVLGKSAQTSVQEHALEIGVVGIVLQDAGAAPRAIVDVVEIGQ
jgi:hypothetical protein